MQKLGAGPIDSPECSPIQGPEDADLQTRPTTEPAHQSKSWWFTGDTCERSVDLSTRVADRNGDRSHAVPLTPIFSGHNPVRVNETSQAIGPQQDEEDGDHSFEYVQTTNDGEPSNTILKDFQSTSARDISSTHKLAKGAELGTLSSDLFGGILINKEDFSSFSEDVEELGITVVRFPGGTHAETGIVVDGTLVYADPEGGLVTLLGDRSQFVIDLTFPELFNPDLLALDDADAAENSYASLSELFQLCIENESAVSVILPVRRYYSGIDVGDQDEIEAQLSIALSDLTLFLDRLVSGKFNNGNYPDRVILEIGNENYGTPIEYTIFAASYIELISQYREIYGLEVEIAFQMSTGSSNYQNLVDEAYFDSFFGENGSALIWWLDGFEYMPGAELSYEEKIYIVDQMMIHILGDSLLEIDALRHHYLTVDADSLLPESGIFHQKVSILEYWYSMIDAAGGDVDLVEFFVSAWTVDSGNDGDYPAGLVAGANMLLLTRYFIESGVDMAAAWGFNGSKEYWPENTPNTVLTFTDEEQNVPSAEVFRLLSEYAAGLTLLASSNDDVLDESNPADFLDFVFWSPEELVIFVTVGDIGADNLEITLDLSSYGFFDWADVYNIGTVDGQVSGYSAVEYSSLSIDSTFVTLTFDQSYEIAMVRLVSGSVIGDESNNVIDGTAESDWIYGEAGNDKLSGWANDDFIFGGNGSDTLYGNDGDDELFGETGSDELRGGDGDDVLHGGSGSDVVDGQAGNDILVGGSGSDNLFGGDGDDTIYGQDSSESMAGDARETDAYESSGDWRSDVTELFAGDTFDGGLGNDDLTGGKGVDEFVFSQGLDTVYGFQPGVDKVVIDESEFGSVDLADLEESHIQTDDGLMLQVGVDSMLLLDVSSWSAISQDIIFS